MPARAALADALYCPFRLTINEHAAAAESASLDWLAKLNLMDARPLARAKKAHLTTLVAGFYPFANLPELSIASDYVSWAFALDDIGDESEVGERPAHLMELFERFEEVLSGSTPSARAIPLEAGLHHILQRLSDFTTSDQMTDFVEGNRAYFGAMLWEANNRAAGVVPDESAYNMFRPAAGAVPSFFALIEPLEHIDLGSTMQNYPDLRALSRLAGSIICWTNDVLSYEKERIQGDVHNLLVVYEHHRHLPPGAAAAEAIRFINRTMQTYIERAALLPVLGPPYDTELRRYLRVLGSVMRITLEWTFKSTRYSEFDARSGAFLIGRTG
jgi:hypothetical protein